MSVLFNSEDHSYHSITDDGIKWISATTLLGNLKQPFDAKKQSIKSSKNPKTIWYGMEPEEIQRIWKAEAKRATDLGTFYHNQRESDILMFETIERDGTMIPIIKPTYKGDVKLAPVQKLENGIYPEHFVYLKSAGVCGQADRVEVVNGTVDIFDFKTNKEVKVNSYVNWEGVSQKMLGPVSHLEDCHIQSFALQLSIYMYIILKHNPHLKPGKLTIHHITFESAGTDQYGYPITKLDDTKSPIIKAIIPYELPYYKSEIRSIIQWLDDNRDKITKK